MSTRHLSLVTRHLPTAALALAAALSLAGCDYFGFTPIREITASPANFEGKEVKLKGTVKSAVIVGGRSVGLRVEETQRLR